MYPVPGPTDQRVGDMRNAESREKVVSHTLSEDGQTCITNYELTSPVEKYIPTTSQISTTAAIAVVATAAAASTPLLLRLIKPLLKQATKKIKGLLGKKIGKPSRAEIKTNQYREKKGLPPLKKK